MKEEEVRIAILKRENSRLMKESDIRRLETKLTLNDQRNQIDDLKESEEEDRQEIYYQALFVRLFRRIFKR